MTAGRRSAKWFAAFCVVFLFALPARASLRFDGSTDILTRTSNNPTVTSFTMMAWVKISVDINTYTAMMIMATNPLSAYYYVGTTADGTTLEAFSNGNPELTGTNLAVGTWYHVAFTVSGTGAGTFLVYLNGVLDITQSGSVSVTNGAMQFGNDDISEFFNGCIAAIKVYSAVLPVADIQNEMQSYRPRRTLNLNTWKPNLSTADQTIDYSGNGFDMTVGGTLATEDGPPISWE